MLLRNVELPLVDIPRGMGTSAVQKNSSLILQIRRPTSLRSDGFEAHGLVLLVESARLLAFKEACSPAVFYRLKIVRIVVIDRV